MTRTLRRGTITLAFVACLVPTRALADEPAAPPTGAVFVDPLGLLMFGPTLGGEVALHRLSVSAYGRWLSGGYLAQRMFPDEDAGDAFALSYGFGLRGRYYFSEDLRRLHGGAGIEYLHARIENDGDLIATNSQYVVPLIELGYRHVMGAFFVDASGAAGYALEVASSVENLPGGSDADLYEVEDASTVYGSLSVDVGVLF